MKVKLTDRFLKTHKPEGNEEIFDTGGPPGFSARVGPRSVSFYLVYRVDGKRERYRVGDYDPEGEKGFKLAAARLEAEKIRGTKTNPAAKQRALKEAGTFEDIAREFLEKMPRAKRKAAQRKVRPSTAKNYRLRMEGKLIPQWGKRTLDSITRKDVRDFFDEMAEETPVEANRAFALLGRFYRWANTEELATTNPCFGLVAPGGEELPKHKNWPLSEIRAVWGALDGESEMMRIYVKLLFLTGCRKGELAAAEWTWFDQDKALLHIPAAANKAGVDKDVPLTPPAVELLDELRGLSGESGYLFPGPKETPITNPQHMKERVAKRAKVEFTLHQIRDCVGDELVELGVDMDTIATVLGHVVGGRITRIYAKRDRVKPARVALEKWASRLEHILSGKPAKVVAINR